MKEITERTFVMIKPDGIQRNFIGEIIKRFEDKSFKLIAMKFVWPTVEHLEKHYHDLRDRSYFNGLVSYMKTGPVLSMVWEGINIVKIVRQMLGVTDPAESSPSSIRGMLCIQIRKTIIHASDSVKSAQKEINLWFTDNELIS